MSNAEGTPADHPRRISLLRGLLATLICLSILAVGGGGFIALANLRQPPPAREPLVQSFNVEVFEVERQNLQEILTGYGTAEADRGVTLAAQVAGEIVEIHPRLKVGETVRAEEFAMSAAGRTTREPGELLIRIDPRPYQQRVTLAENQLAEDEIALELLGIEEANNARLLAQAERDLELYGKDHARVEKLFRDGIATPSDFAKSQLELARYEQVRLQQANQQATFAPRRQQLLKRQAIHQAELELARLDLERTEVRPPFSGALSAVHVEQGQFLRAGEPLCELLDLNLIRVPVPLPQEDYLKLASVPRNQPRVALTADDPSLGSWEGVLTRLAPQGDHQSRTRKVYVEVENRSPVPLLPGTFVQIRIDGPVHRDVMVVPRDSVLEGKVFVVRNGRAQSVPVEVSTRLESLSWIAQGVEPGAQLVLTNLDVLYDGAILNVQGVRRLADEIAASRSEAVRLLNSTAQVGVNSTAE